MKTDEYRAEFERETGFAPTEEFLRRVGHPPQRACGEQPPEAALSEPQAAQKAGMTDEALFGCLKYEAACARVVGGVYRRHYGAERGRAEACDVVYQRMRKVWKQGKAAP